MIASEIINKGTVQLVLRLKHGNQTPEEYGFSNFPVTIGRDEGNDVCLSGLWVGKQHAEVRQTSAGLMFIDLGTLAGTSVKGQRISEYGPLKEGDVLEIGFWAIEVLLHYKQGVKNQTDESSFIAILTNRLREAMDLRRKNWTEISDQAIRLECEGLLIPIIEELTPEASEESKVILRQRVIAESVGLGPLEGFFENEEITEIMVNSYDKIFIERHGKCEETNESFVDEVSVRAVIDRIVAPLGKRIDDASPMVDARLPDGSRVNAVISPLSVRGSCLTIRRFSKRSLNARDLADLGSASEEILEFLKNAVLRRKNIIVAGGTGSGKTTLLNLLSQWIPGNERIVTIEDSAELQLGHQNLVSLEARPANAEGHGQISIRDLLRNSLRMRPDRIIVGECRGSESIDMLQAMNTGHEGSLTTIHANSPRDALSRLEVMVLMSGFDLPMYAIREQIRSAVNLVIQQQRCSDGSRKITSITEVTGLESGTIQTQELFRWDSERRRFTPTGISNDFPEFAMSSSADNEILRLHP